MKVFKILYISSYRPETNNDTLLSRDVLLRVELIQLGDALQESDKQDRILSYRRSGGSKSYFSPPSS